jgi:hypothetical protein
MWTQQNTALDVTLDTQRNPLMLVLCFRQEAPYVQHDHL